MSVLKIRDRQNARWYVIPSIHLSSLRDTDADTYVEVEYNADEDIIRFVCGGTEALTLTSTSISGSVVLDEDDMVSDSADHIATQQSIKAYIDASSTAGSFEYITSAIASGDAAITFSNWDTAYYEVTLIFDSMEPDGDQKMVAIQLSANSGSDWYAGTSYTHMGYVVTDSAGGAYNASGTAGTAYFEVLYAATGNSAGPPDEKGVAGIVAFSLVNATGYTYIHCNTVNQRYDNYNEWLDNAGMLMVDTEVNAIKIYFTAANIAAGKFYLYGRRTV